MLVERVELDRIRGLDGIRTLSALEVGDSIFLSDFKKAQSIRSLSYYFVKSRNLPWKFVFRKMDRGWRVIRIR
ncbi:MAG: hypothetical protein FGM44_05190 [Limnohabitans sp.]|jgi:hypothetical protein|nr:hypothetical protein [Limnohabitans sp.]